MTTLFADTETFSEVDLKSHGTHRYAEAAEVMLFGYAIDDGEPQVWDLTTGAPMPKDLANAIWDPQVGMVWQNSHFDRTVIRHALRIPMPTSRIDDSMVHAMSHSLPGGLDKLGYVLNLDEEDRKQKRGKELIQLFCKPRPKNHILRRATAATHPSEWEEFIEYLKSDIISMREVHRRVPKWNWRPGGFERKLWELDQRINDRGFAVDLELAEAAIRATTQAKAALKLRVQDKTLGIVDSATKRDQLLAFILEGYGVDLPDMASDTLKRRLDDPELPDGVRQLIAIRLEASMASSAKYKALINSTSSDGRLRNSLQFAGAIRTQRWAGRIFQAHNMKRPDPDFKEEETLNATIDAIKAGCLDLVHDEPMRAMANVVRGCIVAPPEKKLSIADLSNIEGRMLVHLAGERWKIKAFAEIDMGIGADMYKASYARAFNVSTDDVDDYMRQIGKVMELALGYEGGVGAFITFAAVYKMDLDKLADAVWEVTDLNAIHVATKIWEWTNRKRRTTYGLSKHVWIACEVLKAKWRNAHPEVVNLWERLSGAVAMAIREQHVPFTAGEHLKAQRDGAWLRVRLPSGRCLCYLHPEVDERGSISYMGINQYTRQWSRIKTYGGKLCIEEGTLVLTRLGWRKIEYITSVDELWDGVEWVATGGMVCNGRQETVNAFGVQMTPDHLVLTDRGWKSASQSKGYNRLACRLPDGYELPRQRREEVPLVGAVPVWDGRRAGRYGIAEAADPRGADLVRMHAQGHHLRAANNPRDDRPPSVLGVALDERPLPTADTSSLAKLRRAWDKSQQALARIVHGLLGGHGANVRERADVGPQEQQRQLHEEQLPMGDAQGAGEQQKAEERVVYDLMNCGPRNRFVIFADGAPLIVHNCENVDQAASRDVLAHGMVKADEVLSVLSDDPTDGIVLTVHDEIITQVPDDDGFGHRELAELMSIVPSWAGGLPLAAKGFDTYRYRKD